MAAARMIDTDAVVIGAGPVGLFQAFQLGLQEIRAHLIDALPHPGGQCAELYPDKPIYDIPGIPLCSGRELTDRLLQQLAPFQVPMHLGQPVQSLQGLPDGRWQVVTAAGSVLRAPTVFIAAGVGAFIPRKPALDGLEAFEQGPEAQVRYFGVAPDALAGQHVVVMGGEDEALGTALQLAEAGSCASLTLLHRVDKFRADAALEQATRSAIGAGRLRLVLGQPVAMEQTQGAEGPRLQALRLATPDQPDGATTRLPLDALLPRLGLSPKLGPIADWGLAMERKQLVVDAERFATSAPGIFAVGDINTYPGKRKLIVCGFHEATLAAFAAAAIVHPERRVLLQYTTTSPRLHELLGVKPLA
ncbi:MAG: NAD(P)/FAD-dependent oxidoreductase [Burkholderiaceae bacterium]|nr:NAD(P)/FAD-dependent oxidoreductase [Burkholderiaceae bacterium]